MARCKLTRMNLRNIRKSREYQTLLIDLVASNVVGKSAAEELLGYTIPAGLLSAGTVTSDDEETGGEGSGSEQGSGGEGSGSEQGSGGESGSGNTVTLLYFNNDNHTWETAEYDITSDPTGDGIILQAQEEFQVNLNGWTVVEEDPEYVEGTSNIADKYVNVIAVPMTLEPGMLIVVEYVPNGDSSGK